MKETRPNAILKTVNEMIDKAELYKEENGKPLRYRIDDVYSELGIFDWWNDYLSVSQLKQMRMFLENAISRGFTGYAGFKVGASGCANGMWATVKESEDGYTPDGATLYRSFTPDYTIWAISFDGENWQGNTVDTKLSDIDRIIWEHRCEEKKAEAKGKLLLYKLSVWVKTTDGVDYIDVQIVADSEDKARAKALEMYGNDSHIGCVTTDYNPVVIA